MIPAPVADHRSHFPWTVRSRKRKAQARHLAHIQFRCQKYPNSSWRQISAVPLGFLVLVSLKAAHGDAEIAAVSGMPPPAAVDLVLRGLWGRGGHWASRCFVALTDRLAGLEYELNNLCGFFACRFKLPLADRVGGRFDEQRASSRYPGRLNGSIRPHNHYQLHHAAKVLRF